MPVSRREFHLNGHATFFIRKYEPFLSLEILGDLQTKFLTPLAAFIDSNDEASSPEVKTKSLMDGVERLSKSLNGKELVALAKLLLNGEYISVTINNEPPEKLSENLLNRAVDDVMELADLIIAVITENYKNVFQQGLTRIGQARESSGLR